MNAWAADDFFDASPRRSRRAFFGLVVAAHVALYPGEGHGVRKFPALIDFATRAVGWFERHMPPEGRGPD